ncbi:unnamed protein product [Somion occarium]|uniref:LAGLIDADG homing endonuclease n=1 Tax=Somion occarium TaxID=3059160 RepID=A0ABP1CXA8_9APHY
MKHYICLSTDSQIHGMNSINASLVSGRVEEDATAFICFNVTNGLLPFSYPVNDSREAKLLHEFVSFVFAKQDVPWILVPNEYAGRRPLFSRKLPNDRPWIFARLSNTLLTYVPCTMSRNELRAQILPLPMHWDSAMVNYVLP